MALTTWTADPAAAAELIAHLRESRRETHRRAQTELVAELTALAARHRELAVRSGELTTALEDKHRQQRETAARTADQQSKISAMEARLNAGEGMTSRDLVALQGDIDSAKAALAKLEDAELELLESIEELQGDVAGLKQESAGIAAQGKEKQALRKRVEAEIATRLAELETAIAQDLAQMGPAADPVRADLDASGPGLMPCDAGACGNCGDALAGADLAEFKALQPGTVFSCPDCEVPLLRQ